MENRSVSLTLPKALSANRYWRTYMPKGFKAPVTALSQEAKDYKTQVQRIALLAGVRKPILGRVAIDVRMYPQRPKDAAARIRKNPASWDDDVQSIDLDNSLKVLLDAMKGIVFEDDKRVFRIAAERMEPDGEARLEVTVTPMALATPQVGLL